jgi:hypothetical protein
MAEVSCQPHPTQKERPINIAIIGADNVGRTLGAAWLSGGHDVSYGVRNTDDPKGFGFGLLRGRA